MQDLLSLMEEDVKGLPAAAVGALAQQMLQRLRCQDNELRFKHATIGNHLPAGATEGLEVRGKTEAMSAEQRPLFEETFVEDEASL